MRLFSRFAVSAFVLPLLFACSGLPVNSQPPTVSVPSAVRGTSSADVRPTHVAFHSLAFVPNVSQAILMDFVATGPAQAGVPCTGCVLGVSGGDTVGLSGPSNFVPKGATWQYSEAFTDITYKGSCTLSWKIANGAKTIDTFSTKFKIAKAGGWYLFGVNRNRPSYSGSATLTGQVTCGSHKQSTTAPMVFQ